MSTIVNNRRSTSSKGRQPATNASRNIPAKRSSLDKHPVTDGVYADPRFTHVVYTLVGMNVQVQVKNGNKYEGIFKTISPQMDVVIEIAHKVEDTVSPMAVPSCPTRDMIIDKLIFKKDDVVSVTCLSVDLDYAVKDTFTDAAISRGNNGNSVNKDLQPWDGETGDELGLEEGEASNGWDPKEMFKTNQEQFCVKSSYDENLSQYTTVLNKADTKEFRRREEDARRIAREIERSEDYRKHIDLENGDDEEALYSSVHRPASQQTGDKKYLPPHARKNNNKGQGNGVDNYQQQQRSSHNKNRQPPVQHQSQLLSPQQVLSPQNFPQQKQNQPATTVPAQQTNLQSSVPGPQTFKDQNVNKVNGDEHVSAAHDIHVSIAKTSQNELSSQSAVPFQEANESKRMRPPVSPSVNKNTKTAKIDELKQFHTEFKLGDKKESERKVTSIDVDNRECKVIDNNNVVNNREDDDRSGKLTPVKKSSLNPFAKEFKPNPAPSLIHPAQTPTPPRPQTQSPVVTSVVPMYFPIVQQQAPASRPFPPKKAVVSAYPQHDFRTAAQHATGQPLLAGTMPQQYLPYVMTQQMIQQHTPAGYSVMNQHRMMNPAMGPASHATGGMDQGNSQTVYMPQTGPHPLQAHIGQQGIPQTQQTHIAHPGGNHQNQGVQMTQVTGHHPAPSPVQHVQGGQANHPGQVPPTAGTPQPLNYPALSLQGHLHGSHNPTSPHTIHASNPYTYSSHAPQFTFSQGQPTTVSHTMPSQIQSAPVPNHLPVVMIPPPSNQVQHQHQFQAHMAGPTQIPGQGHIMHHGVPVQGPTHSQVQYVSHAMASQGPPVIPYQQGQ